MLEKTFGRKIENTEYIDREGAYVVIFSKENEIALVKNNTGYFLLGGGVENNDGNYEECIKRECIEEAGLSVKVENFICRSDIYRYSDRAKEYRHGIGNFYIGSIIGKVCVPVEEDHELVFMNINECMDKLFLENQVYAVKRALELRKSK